MRILSFFLFIVLFHNALAQENITKEKINSELLLDHWSANWIASGEDSGLDYGVYHFRKTFNLEKVSNEFIIHISADNRYRLFINGTPICSGPSRGDLLHWKFESIDIAPFLKQGKNTISAIVWNFAQYKPWAQISLQTAFILQGNTEKEAIVNTDTSWKVFKNQSYSAIHGDNLNTFIVVGPGDKVDASKYPWDWEKQDFDDTNWKNATILDSGRPKEIGTDIKWCLEPREIPLMENKPQRFQEIRRTDATNFDNEFLSGNKKIEIKANQEISVLLDQGTLTTGYPEILISGGKGAKIELIYAEALFDENGNKGNRNEIEQKTIQGNFDIFLPDGGNNRLFRPLWFRTWRYVELRITTSDSPLVIEDFKSEFTAYPFTENASFTSDDKQLSKIWDVGWNTARLCAGETYFDCPYYEQMQYVGDTRIQALISIYVSGDDRLMRQAIQMYDNSRFSEGLTMSRYPASTPQVIPPYSLFWVDMVHDYYMHREDAAFVQSFLNGIDNVLEFFIAKIDPKTGLLGKTGYWNFVDWAEEWPWDNTLRIGGVPKGGINGQSSILSFQLVYSARHAADLHRASGNIAKADYYEKIANQIVKSIQDHCWDTSTSYFADTPKKEEFSMHAQIFAVLTDAVAKNEMQDFVLRFEKDTSLIQPTFYFRFYLTQALKKANLSNKYLESLTLWKDMLDLGLTTFAEKPDPTRSDCHAWSASPNYDFLATIAGIEPAEPGFKSVKMTPSLGDLNFIEGKMPHPKGIISFKLKKTGQDGIEGEVLLPKDLTGTFYWNGKKVALKNQTKIQL